MTTRTSNLFLKIDWDLLNADEGSSSGVIVNELGSHINVSRFDFRKVLQIYGLAPK